MLRPVDNPTPSSSVDAVREDKSIPTQPSGLTPGNSTVKTSVRAVVAQFFMNSRNTIRNFASNAVSFVKSFVPDRLSQLFESKETKKAREGNERHWWASADNAEHKFSCDFNDIEATLKYDREDSNVNHAALSKKYQPLFDAIAHRFKEGEKTIERKYAYSGNKIEKYRDLAEHRKTCRADALALDAEYLRLTNRPPRRVH